MAREHGSGADGPARRAGDKGRYGRLSRERVLLAALEVVDRDGLSGLSMRKLGAELDVEAMALYRYAPSKDALLDGLVEVFCLQVDRELEQGPADPDGAAGAAGPPDWRTCLHRIARATLSVALRHPHVVPLLATRLLATPLARRPLPFCGPTNASWPCCTRADSASRTRSVSTGDSPHGCSATSLSSCGRWTTTPASPTRPSGSGSIGSQPLNCPGCGRPRSVSSTGAGPMNWLLYLDALLLGYPD